MCVVLPYKMLYGKACQVETFCTYNTQIYQAIQSSNTNYLVFVTPIDQNVKKKSASEKQQIKYLLLVAMAF